MFKIIGVISGYYLFGLLGAFIGLFIGSFIDRIRIYGTGGVNPMGNLLRQTVFLETVFISMGKLAKADGRVTQDEIDHVEEFMQKMGMTPEHRLRAIALFKQGADPAFDIGPAYQRFMAICGHTKNLKQILLLYLIVMALADGHFHPAEEALLAEIAGHLGYDNATFRQMLDMVLNQTHFAAGQVSSEAALDDAHKALGVSKDSSDQEVKRAYRKLMSQYHPDKLMGQGVPEDMIAMATEQAKEIQLAYDLIKKNRNL
ncbi:MAG TPA: co-chaperone DjlA [Gallionellaceae bacterium]|nr:co-chaperone DjlA [Gallionellaceae bacterium]